MNEKDVHRLGMQAQMEQSAAAMCSLAQVYGDYYKALLAAAFTVDQAFGMVLDMQRTMLQNQRPA